jgi:hypothetical protein
MQNFSVTNRKGGKYAVERKENLTELCFVVYADCYLFILVVGCKKNQRKYRSLSNDIILFVTLNPVKYTQSAL